MMQENIQTIAGYIALAVPATVAITSLAKLAFEWLNQRHAINTSRIDQTHQITTHYLNKALDPAVPLAIRHQLLRFLATPDKNGSRLSDWARSELRRVEVIIDEANQSVADAEKAVQAARTPTELSAAEKKLALASRRQRFLTEPAKAPPLSSAALKAGLIEEKEIGAVSLKNTDLKKIKLLYRNLRESDFTGSCLAEANFQGCDLRGANFSNCDLSGVEFYGADLRAAIFRNANCKKTSFHKAHLESADFTDCNLENADLRSTFDGHTKWPKEFDLKTSGAVHIDGEENSPAP